LHKIRLNFISYMKLKIFVFICVFYSFAQYSFSQVIYSNKLDILLKANVLSNQNSLQDAATLLGDAISNSPSDSVLFVKRAEIFYQLQHYQATIQDLEKINIENNSDLCLMMCKSYLKIKKTEVAMIYLEKSMKCTDKISLRKLKTDLDIATLVTDIQFDKWVNKYYSNEDKMLSSAQQNFNHGNINEALNTIEDLKKIESQKFNSYVLLAEIKFFNGDFKDAAKFYEKALKINENYAVRQKKYEIELLHNNYKKAYDDLYKLIESKPENIELYLLATKLANTLNNNIVAQNHLDFYLKYNKNSNQGNFFKAKILFENQDNKTSLEMVNKLIKEDISNPDYYLLRGKIYRVIEMFDFALRDLSMSLDLNPKCTEAYLIRGELRYEKGDLEGAKHDWIKAKEQGSYKALNLLHSNLLD